MQGPNGKLRPWMIAAWPGMGNVAVIAAGYLVQKLRMTELEELPPGDNFDVVEVDVKQGLVSPPRLPRGVLFRWDNPGQGRDLIVFIGESQPSVGNYAYARRLLDAAVRLDVDRVVTFASLASGLHPAENPKVSGVATDEKTLEELRRAEVLPLSDGEIGGLNGLAIGVAAERGITGMCLLAEIPYFAMRVPNPKAARAALSVFCVLAGIEVSLEELGRQAELVDRALIEAMERAQKQEEGEEETDEDEVSPAPMDTEPPMTAPPVARVLEPAEKDRIEELFALVRKDPSQGSRLKNELDRLGVFKQYEGRFLDLFRKAG